jgi:4-diphosphocytidyl-2-C-methyl-D-erythritol kinase
VTPLQLDAPAKLNLSLSVTGRRADGYHELASVFVLLDLADRLLLLPGAPGLRIEGSDEIPPGRATLAWRGGDEKPQPALLAEIGADVPFFVAQAPVAYVTGIGERVELLPQPRPRPHVVLAIPPFRLSTRAVFAELRRSDWSAAPPRTVDPGHNDLLAAALRLRPELDDLLRLMREAGADPHLTGSGPTLFALTDDPQRSASIRARLAAEGVRTIATRLRQRPASIEAIEEEEQ